MEFVAVVISSSGTLGQPPDPFAVDSLSVSLFGLNNQYSSFIRTVEPVPYRIRVQHGVDQSRLSEALAPEDVGIELRQFIGGRPLVLGWDPGVHAALERLLGSIEVPIFDIGELAQLLRPGLNAGNLHALGRSIGAA